MSVKKELDKKFSGKKISAEKSAAGENVKDNKISRKVKKEKSKTGVTAAESGVTDLLSLYLGEKVAVSATAEPVQGKKKKTGSSASKAAAGSAGKNSKKTAGSANAETGDGELSELVVYAAERTIIKAGFDSVNASLNNPNAADGEYLGNLRKIINRQSVSKKYGLTEIKKAWCDLTAGKVLIPVDLGANTIVLPADSLENIEGKVVYEYEKIEEVDIVYYSKKLESVE